MASNPVVRAFPVYWKNRIIAEAYENEYSLKLGRTRLFAQKGYFAHSKGAVITDLTITHVLPQVGTELPLLEQILAQDDIKIGIPVGGKVHRVTMAAVENTMKSNTEKGTCEGVLKLEGGKPSLSA